ncbi:MAG: hypothetical protein ABIK68_07295, partial [bacterium]
KIIEKNVQEINAEMIEQRKGALKKSEKIFEKIKQLDTHFEFGEQDANSPQFTYIAKKFLDAIQGIEAEIDFIDFDPLNIRENVQRIIDSENIRNRGYNIAVSSLIGILDDSHLGYQHIENFKNCRKTIIREYANMNPLELPDEHYIISLIYQDDLQLREERVAYCQQMDEFDDQIIKLSKVFENLVQERKREDESLDFEMVSDQILNKNKSKKEAKLDAEEQENNRAELGTWDEISFILPEKNELEKMNETFVERKEIMKKRFRRLHKRITEFYGYEYSSERIILEQRLDFLETEYDNFGRKYNPFHAHPGLFLDVSASTIKRRETTIHSMSNVVAQFISRISIGFVDSSFEEFHQRRLMDQAPDTRTFTAAT